MSPNLRTTSRASTRPTKADTAGAVRTEEDADKTADADNVSLRTDKTTPTKEDRSNANTKTTHSETPKTLRVNKALCQPPTATSRTSRDTTLNAMAAGHSATVLTE